MGVLNKIFGSKAGLLLTVVLLVLINWLASLYHARLDFTNEKRFTLSKPTKKILAKLDETVQVKNWPSVPMRSYRNSEKWQAKNLFLNLSALMKR